jgi:hypothetical protein
MPAATMTVKVRHEDFCVSEKPRIESYVHMGDDPASGRSAPTHDVTRCLECGAATYKARS